MTTHTKLDIAREQLRTAVMLYCSGRDRFSAITLAGAADVILSQLLLNEGKENFSDLLMRKDAEVIGCMPERAAHGRSVNDMLMINALKHMDPGDDDCLEMDVRISGLATVSKAVSNYVMLCGDTADFVEVLRCWARVFTPKGLDQDGNSIQ
jgi:hypothetical protein